MRIAKLFLILIVVWLIGVFIKLPSWPMRGEISKVTIKHSDHKLILETQDEIQKLKDACGAIWFTPFVLNSWEGNPSWMIQVHRADGSVDKIYVDENEFGSNGYPNEKILSYLKQKTANQQVDPIVKTPADEVEAQGTQGHP